MRYKVGDQVKVKSIDWYNKNKNKNGEVVCGDHVFTGSMALCCGEVLTIEKIASDNSYFMKDEAYWWTDDMFEGLANEEQDYILHIEKDWDKEQEIQITDGFEFQDENGKTINARKVKIVKKKPKYPATYEECCEVLNLTPYYNVAYDYYRGEELDALYQLLVCRDAYWKIAGDWKPDWKSDSAIFYVIFHKKGEIIRRVCRNTGSFILAFPTEEMRDTFYENFEDLINECKEFL